MKKIFMFLFVVFSLFSCEKVSALKLIASAYIRVFPDEPSLEYHFFSVNLNNTLDVLALGARIAAFRSIFFYDTEPIPPLEADRIIENNTSLSQAVKDKMRQLGSNVCLTFYDGFVYVNIRMQNGTYTTLLYS